MQTERTNLESDFLLPDADEFSFLSVTLEKKEIFGSHKVEIG